MDVKSSVTPSADPKAGTTFDDGTVTELFDGGASELVLSRHPEGEVSVVDRHRGREQAVEVDGRVVVKPGFFGHGRRRWRVTYRPSGQGEPVFDEGADVDPQPGVAGVGSPDRVDGGEAGADGEPVDAPLPPVGVDEGDLAGRLAAEDPPVDG